MNPLVQVSPTGGKLVLAAVAGTVNAAPNPENEVDAAAGAERSMYVYAPASGVPHPKQAAVLYVLRDGADEASARRAVDELALDVLAEANHLIVVLPNPAEGGWNYAADPARDDDVAFLVRCFAALKGSLAKVSGFNGLMFHVGCGAAASAMVWTLAQTHPLDAAGIMVGAFPEGYEPPAGAAEQVAWLYETNAEAQAHLAEVDRVPANASAPRTGAVCHASAENPCVRYYTSGRGLCAAELAEAWARLFSGTRRWRNDVCGTYQPRPDFEGRGFVAHVADSSLPLEDGLPRTWYEYVPARVRASAEPAPLVIYLHGINCVGLYGAEQSGWADIADRDGLMCVFPDATVEMRWNAWDDPRIPADIPFILALIDQMDAQHPVDRTRVYLSGFSMGSMTVNAIACAYPEVFAGAVACNAASVGYLHTLDESADEMLMFNPASRIRDIEPSDDESSPMHRLADSKRAAYAYRMPFVQLVGLNDNTTFYTKGRIWPVAEGDTEWIETVRYWKEFNGIPAEPLLDPATETGFAAPERVEQGRFIHQSWEDEAGEPGLYHLIAVRRMPHAVDLAGIELGWSIVKRYRRLADGSLGLVE